MADFRRVLTALAVLALLTGFAVTASAQVTTPFQCTAQTAVPPLLRAEGVTELIGDIVLVCTGGAPVTLPLTAPATVPTANFQVFVGNTTVTSRLFNFANGGASGASEALLLIDEPTSGFSPAAPTGCGATCGQTATLPNVYQGVVSGNSVTFIGVPLNPPGTTGGQRIYRMTNIRINASAIGAGAGFSGSQVLAFTSISGSTSVLVTNPQQVVGFVQPGMAFSVRDLNDATDADLSISGRQCSNAKPGDNQLHLRFAEGFATAFKMQLAGANESSQATPGAIYNTESGLTLGAAVTGLANTGKADFGTRLRATFRNIPTGVSVYVALKPQSVVAGSHDATLIPNETVVNTAPNTPFALTKTDTINSTDALKLTVDSTGTAVAVWEVTASNPLVVENFDFRVWFGWSANPAGNSPASGVQGTVAGALAPTSTSSAAKDATVPIPRFVDTSTPKNIVIVNICRTSLLFPFVTAADGFDTGIAIANTTSDGGKTTPQSGTCTLNFFGDNAPSAFTTPSAVAGGTVYVNVASGIAPGFRGYMIARCNFQHAHGFAFVQSTVGYTPSTAAMGYLPLVMVFDRPSNEALDN